MITSPIPMKTKLDRKPIQRSFIILFRSRSSASRVNCSRLCSLRRFSFDPLKPERVVPLHLLEPESDESLDLLEVGKYLELKRVHPALGPLDLVKELLHGGLELRGLDDGLDQFLIGVCRLIDPWRGPDYSVAALVQGRDNPAGLDVRHHHAHEVPAAKHDL